MTHNDSHLRVQFVQSVARMVKRYPAQIANVPSHARFARDARWGRVVRRIRSKGGFTDIAPGSECLFQIEDTGMVLVWAPRPDGDCVCTLADADSVKSADPSVEACNDELHADVFGAGEWR